MRWDRIIAMLQHLGIHITPSSGSELSVDKDVNNAEATRSYCSFDYINAKAHDCVLKLLNSLQGLTAVTMQHVFLRELQ